MATMVIWLVVELSFNPLKNDGVEVSWDDDIPIYYGKSSKCFKPPTG